MIAHEVLKAPLPNVETQYKGTRAQRTLHRVDISQSSASAIILMRRQPCSYRQLTRSVDAAFVAVTSASSTVAEGVFTTKLSYGPQHMPSGENTAYMAWNLSMHLIELEFMLFELAGSPNISHAKPPRRSLATVVRSTRPFPTLYVSSVGAHAQVSESPPDPCKRLSFDAIATSANNTGSHSRLRGPSAFWRMTSWSRAHLVPTQAGGCDGTSTSSNRRRSEQLGQ